MKAQSDLLKTFSAVPPLAPRSAAEVRHNSFDAAESLFSDPLAHPPLAEPPPGSPIALADPQEVRVTGPFLLSDPAAPTRYGATVAGSATPIQEPKAWPIYLVAAGVAVVWAFAPLAYALGYGRGVVPLHNDSFMMLVFAGLAIGPGLIIMLAAYLLHQGRKLAAEAQRTKALADAMLTPAAMAAAEAGSSVEAVRRQIADAAAMAVRASRDLTALRDNLGAEGRRLLDAADQTSRSAETVVASLSRQREGMEAMSDSLAVQAGAVDDAITRHARMVAEASDLAETQLREAEATLTARAADLTAAVGQAGAAARTAGEDLARQAARLETAGVGLGDQLGALEEGLTEQRAALVGVAHALRSDQEDFAVELESRQAQLQEVIGWSRTSVTEVGEQASKGASELRGLIDESALQFEGLLRRVAGEREALVSTGAQAAAQLAQAAQAERAKLQGEVESAVQVLLSGAEQARVAAEVHAVATQRRLDSLGEASFAAARQADDIFENRMREARALIEESVVLVEQAGGKTVDQLTQRVAAARETMTQMDALLADIDARTARLPQETLARAEEVRSTLEASMEELAASARRVGEETKAIDAAFHERVRKNYEMLSEAARLMGSVTGASGQRPSPLGDRGARSGASIAPAPLAVPRLADSADAAGLRPRLKLTPTASDTEFREVFETASGRPGGELPGPDLTWKDVLAGIEGQDGEGAATSLAEEMAAEISGMGVDALALMPEPKVAEIAQTVSAGDVERARDMVRRLAPAASRRLVRRLFSDPALRERANAFVVHFQGRLSAAGGGAAALLKSEAGRSYLLLDAASSDLA